MTLALLILFLTEASDHQELNFLPLNDQQPPYECLTVQANFRHTRIKKRMKSESLIASGSFYALEITTDIIVVVSPALIGIYV